MRNFEQRKAEVFRRSEERIHTRRKRRSCILAFCIPLCLILVVWSAGLFPKAPTTNGGTNASGDLVGSTNDNPSFPPSSQGQPTKYTIYTGFATADGSTAGGASPGSSPNENAAPNVSYGDISDLDFSYSHRTNFVNSTADPSLEFSFAGRTLQAKYSRSFTNSLYQSEDPNLRLLGSYDEYNGENFTIRFRQQDGTITFFAYTDDCSIAGPLTEEKAKELGDAFVTERFGVGFLTEYSTQSTVPSSNNRDRTIAVTYTKTICGLKTTDRVIITYNMQGEVVGYNASTKGVFDAAEEVITPETIRAAEEYLLSTLSSEWRIGTRKLVMDASGTFYLYVGMVTNKDGLCTTHEMCINLT